VRRAVVVILFAALCVLAIVFASSGSAQTVLPPVFIQEVVRGDPGSIHQVAVIDIPDEFIGQVCEVTVIGANNGSVHPGSNIILRGGANEVTIPDVEAVAGEVIQGTATVTVAGTSIDVFVQLGPDGVFSGAATQVRASCEGPPPTTVTVATTTPPTVPTTTAVPTVPTAPPGALPHTE
jgi:hypothetical protein